VIARRRDPLADPEKAIRRVYAYIAYRIGYGPDAEDLTSEVFERALRYRDSYDASRGAPEAWLIGIARRCLSEALAATRARPTAQPEDRSAPADLEDEAVERLALRGALSRLGERDRELIALRYGADLSARAIAAVTGERTNTIEVALHRAIGRLRNVLTEELDDSAAARERAVTI
jgi:RNA polymerase sigma-70 factor, ECF subfamily